MCIATKGGRECPMSLPLSGILGLSFHSLFLFPLVFLPSPHVFEEILLLTQTVVL